MGTRGNEKVAETILAAIALTSVGILGLITAFIFKEGLPVIVKTGLVKFVLGTTWLPSKGVFGILPMIIGTVAVTGGALLLGIPVGLACAVYLSEFATEKSARLVKPAVELLAGIPSVVYGFIGLTVVVPWIRDHLGGPGFSVLAASVVLGIMLLPTMITVSYDALRAVPQAYRDSMMALGATPWQTVKMAILPAAKSGITAAAILSTGRAVGETMAVIMVAGNATAMPTSFLDPVRTLTSNIALEMGYSTGVHRQALFATGVVLFVIITILNTAARSVLKRGRRA